MIELTVGVFVNPNRGHDKITGKSITGIIILWEEFQSIRNQKGNINTNIDFQCRFCFNGESRGGSSKYPILVKTHQSVTANDVREYCTFSANIEKQVMWMKNISNIGI